MQVQEEAEEQPQEKNEEAAPPTLPPQETVVQMRSPRSQRRERMQALAAEKLAAMKARQVRYDRVLDGFLGY